MILQDPVPPAPPPPPPFDPSMFDPNLLLMNDGISPVFILIPVVALIALTIILWPIMRAFARRLESKGGGDTALRAEVDQLHERIGEVDLLQGRVAELEERLDFAERLLAQVQQPARLGAPTEERGR